MTKNELIGCIAEKSGLAKKDSESALNAIVASITAALVEGNRLWPGGTSSHPARFACWL